MSLCFNVSGRSQLTGICRHEASRLKLHGIGARRSGTRVPVRLSPRSKVNAASPLCAEKLEAALAARRGCGRHTANNASGKGENRVTALRDKPRVPLSRPRLASLRVARVDSESTTHDDDDNDHSGNYGSVLRPSKRRPGCCGRGGVCTGPLELLQGKGPLSPSGAQGWSANPPAGPTAFAQNRHDDWPIS